MTDAMFTDRPSVVDVHVTRGSSTEAVLWTYARPGGTPFDLTGYHFHLVVLDATGATVLDTTDAAGGIFNGTTDGYAQLTLSLAATRALAPGVNGAPHTYALRETDPTGLISHVSHRGLFYVDTENVT